MGSSSSKEAAATKLNQAKAQRGAEGLFEGETLNAYLTSLFNIDHERLSLKEGKFEQYIPLLCDGIKKLEETLATRPEDDPLVKKGKGKVIDVAHNYYLRVILGNKPQKKMSLESVINLAITTARFAKPGGARTNVVGNCVEALKNEPLPKFATPKELEKIYESLLELQSVVQDMPGVRAKVDKKVATTLKAMKGIEPAAKKIGEIYGVSIDERDEKSVQEGQWFTDHVMTAYSNKLNTEVENPEVHVVNPSMISLLRNHVIAKGDLSKEAQTATKFVCIANDREIHGSHWVAMEINVKTREVNYYNSLKEKNEKTGEVIDHYEGVFKKQANELMWALSGTPVDEDNPLAFTSKDTPPQSNSSDCGPIAFTVAKTLKMGATELLPWRDTRGEMQGMVEESKKHLVHHDWDLPSSLKDHMEATAANIAVPSGSPTMIPEYPSWDGPGVISNIVDGHLSIMPSDMFQNQDKHFEITTEAFRHRCENGENPSRITPRSTLPALCIPLESKHPLAEGDIRKTATIGQQVYLKVAKQGGKGPVTVLDGNTHKQSYQTSGQAEAKSSARSESSSVFPPALDGESVQPFASDENSRLLLCHPRAPSGGFDETTTVSVTSEQLLGKGRSFDTITRELSKGNASAFTTSTAEERKKFFPTHQPGLQQGQDLQQSESTQPRRSGNFGR